MTSHCHRMTTNLRMAANTRSIEEALEAAKTAKLELEELRNVIQCISFPSEMATDNIKLLELDPTLLQCLEQGESLVLRGDPEDTAVLCTATKTYEVRAADTSNSLVMIPDFKVITANDGEGFRILPQEISSVFHTYLEVQPILPRVEKLKSLLRQNLYRGKEYEDDELPKYNLDDLLEVVQSSEAELVTVLASYEACLINGYWRFLDFDYRFRVVSHMLNFIEENSWSSFQIHRNKTLDTLSELEQRDVLEHLLLCYSDETTDIADDGDKIRIMNETKICQLYAEMLLRATEKFHLGEFLETWKLSVPEGYRADLVQLQGLALIDRLTIPECICFFSASDLPFNVQERFKVLFGRREKWTYDDIHPYLAALATPKCTVNNLLLKYTRSIVTNGVRLYNRK